VKIVPQLFLAGVTVILSTGSLAQTPNGPGSSGTGQRTRRIHQEVPHKIDIQYLLFLPKDYDKSKNHWPLILYLHGGSLRGEDINQVKRLGLTKKVEDDPNFPFMVVSPQCPNGEIWTDVDALGAILDDVTRNYRVDPDRVYVTGHSMGGRGALYLAFRMPDRFAAAVALAPVFPITAWAGRLAPLPCWLFHGTNDQFTPLKEVEELVHATEAAGGHPQLTVLPGRDHYILDVYDRSDLYEWLAKQKKKSRAAD
jgi:predicted peptidase